MEISFSTNVKRIFKSGYDNFKRNSWLSIATIITMVLSVMLLTGTLLLNYGSNAFVKEIQNKVDVSIYFKTDVSEVDILKIQEELTKLDTVAKVEYTSREKALQDFKEQSAKDQIIIQTLEEIGDNPLSASLNIKAKKPGDYTPIISYIENSLFKDKLLSVDFTENKLLVDRANSLSFGLKTSTIILTVILSSVAIVVAFNTIRMAIHSVGEELKIMNLVGGSNWFIRGPFIVEGILYGAIASVVSFILYIPIIFIFGSKIDKFLGFVSITKYFVSHMLLIFLAQLVFGVLLGVVSSILATNKYLKQVE